MEKPSYLPIIIGTGFGAGYSPVAPGTVGALVAVLMWFLMAFLVSDQMLILGTVVLILLFTMGGVWAANQLEPYWGEDSRRVVVDEMVGVWIPLLGVTQSELWYILAAFVLFRFFDILKPLGIRRMEEFPGGIGVMMDDILSGVYSLLLIMIVKWVLM